jgi:hypothetical protein
MGKHNQPRRQKCAEKKYTQSEVNRMLRESTEAVAKHNAYTTVASCALAMHRIHGFGQTRILRVLDEMDRLAFEAFSFEEIRQELLNETGINISRLWEEKNDG